MANYYTNIAFDLRVTPAEADRLRLIFGADFESEDWFSPELEKLFGTDREGAIKRLEFRDHDYPYFSVDVDVEPQPADDGKVRVMVTAYEGPDLEALANALQLVLDETLPVGFEWSNHCDRHRPGAFGGGWCAVFKDRIEWEQTGTRLEMALKGEID